MNVKLTVGLLLAAVAAQGEVDWTRLNIAAREHAKTPIRAGVPGVRPFWNAHAKAFIHPPAFEFQEVKGATAYHFVLMTAEPGRAGRPRPADTARPEAAPYQRFTLNIRVPGWCVGKPVPSDLYSQVVAGTLDDFSVKVNGAAVKVLPVKGYCVIDREWKAGDVVEIEMNMPVRRIKANDKVWLDRGYSAVERGPLVYCAEGADNGGKAFFTTLPLDASFTEGGIEIASTKMVSLKGGGLTLIPYFAWCHRGAGEMQTWFAEREDLLRK